MGQGSKSEAIWGTATVASGVVLAALGGGEIAGGIEGAGGIGAAISGAGRSVVNTAKAAAATVTGWLTSGRGREIYQKGLDYAMNETKQTHIFRNEAHNLEGLVERLGVSGL